MSDETERGKRFVRVKDAAGNDWLCPLDSLMNPVGRYAGDIKVVD
jgi:hypothetical protein